MTVSPVNILRVTHSMRTSSVTASLSRNQFDLFRSQNQIASGRSFLRPSDDPIAAARTLNLSQALNQQNQFLRDLQHGDSFLASADSSISEINGLLIEASSIASQVLSNLTSAEEREAEAEVVAGIRQQLMVVGNRKFNGRYIFAGRKTDERPFVDALGGVAYTGDTGELESRIESGVTSPISIPGSRLFGALSNPITTSVDLTPQLSESTRLEDLRGANEQGIRLGVITINEVGGAGQFNIDLSDADTIGDVVDFINLAATEAGANLTAEIGDSGINITPGGFEVTILDPSTGAIASNLGILTPTATTGPIVGVDLGPRVTRLTSLSALAGGANLDLQSGFIITNGPRSATIDLSDAETVQDMINAINNAGVYVFARINEQGTGIDIFNQVSGTSMSIAENDGTTAADLGIRTLNEATTLDELNLGLGVIRMEGRTDLSITAKDGTTFEVDLDTAETIGDVIDLINQAAQDAGVSVTASLAETGTGLQIEDGSGGASPLVVGGANLSQAALDLGIDGRTSDMGTTLIGSEVNPRRTQGILDALLQLEDAMRRDDTRGISLAGERLDGLASQVTRMHGIVGARSQSMRTKLEQMEDTLVTTQIFLSEVQDLDFATAIMELQATQTRLQANLQTGSSLLNLSLLDFLR